MLAALMPALAKIPSPHGTPPSAYSGLYPACHHPGPATPLPIHLKRLRRHQDILPQHLLAGTRSPLISCLPRYLTSPAYHLISTFFPFPRYPSYRCATHSSFLPPPLTTNPRRGIIGPRARNIRQDTRCTHLKREEPTESAPKII
jgi:hypothetical protein